MRLMLALPVLAAAALMADAALAQTAPAGGAAPAPDGPITTASPATPPPPAPGQTPALLTAPPGSDPLDGWLPYQGDDKKIHGQVSVGFDSRGGHYVSGSAEGPLGDNAWMGIAVTQSKWRW